jgi:hypothetical protein
VAVTDQEEIARLIHESGRALIRHWPHISPHLGLAGTNLLADETGALGQLLDCGAGIDFFVAYGHGRGVAGIATRCQWTDVYRTLTWRNRSTGSEVTRSCHAYLDNDARLRPDWCIHLYEHAPSRRLWGFVAAHADALARYYLDGSLVINSTNHSDGTNFVGFGVLDLRSSGVDVIEKWAPNINPDQPMLGSTYRLR